MTQPALKYNFAIASDWEYDWDFLQILEINAHKRGLTTYLIWPHNYKETIEKLKNNELQIDFFFDRASDTSPEFFEIQKALSARKTDIFEPLPLIKWASDKATMHLEFIANGLHTPFTIILPPFDSGEHCYLSLSDLAKLNRFFIIKPANTTGGGIGVVDGAETLQDILNARQAFKSDKYLLQEKVVPSLKDGKRFWFRGFYSCGLVQCAWWNDLTHIYEALTKEEVEKYKLQSLFDIVEKIAQICKLNFFSTEIVCTEQDKFIVIDYVNSSCDMRIKSKHYNGIPDYLVHNIAESIVIFIKQQLSSQSTITSARFDEPAFHIPAYNEDIPV